MIQPLRKIHRGMFSLLLVVLPVLFAAGLVSRHKASTRPSHIDIASSKVASEQTVVLGGRKFHIGMLNNREGGSEWRLKLMPESPLLAPDVLVYWSKSDATPDLPSGAILLGALEPAKQYPLPQQEMKENGQGFLILYSLGWKKTLGSVELGSVGGHP